MDEFLFRKLQAQKYVSFLPGEKKKIIDIDYSTTKSGFHVRIDDISLEASYRWFYPKWYVQFLPWIPILFGLFLWLLFLSNGNGEQLKKSLYSQPFVIFLLTLGLIILLWNTYKFLALIFNRRSFPPTERR